MADPLDSTPIIFGGFVPEDRNYDGIDAVMLLSGVSDVSYSGGRYFIGEEGYSLNRLRSGELPIPWPQQYQKDYGQAFNPWTFLRNAAYLRGVKGEVTERSDIARWHEIVDELTAEAERYTRAVGDGVYVFNNFPFPFLFGNCFGAPFYGAFLNGVTAYGFLLLFEATQDEAHLLQATKLLRTLYESADSTIPLSGADSEGLYWLYEYTFKGQSEDNTFFLNAGFEPVGSSDFIGARIYNGHIHALLALMKLDSLGYCDREGRTAIRRSLGTLDAVLSRQLFDDRYFSYMVDVPELPDYGQERAVHLSEGLCSIAGSRALCATAEHFRSHFESAKAELDERCTAGAREAEALIRVIAEDYRATRELFLSPDVTGTWGVIEHSRYQSGAAQFTRSVGAMASFKIPAGVGDCSLLLYAYSEGATEYRIEAVGRDGSRDVVDVMLLPGEGVFEQALPKDWPGKTVTVTAIKIGQDAFVVNGLTCKLPRPETPDEKEPETDPPVAQV